jgi:HAE1 family hydrophobic/amphiphilic exporter-1
MQWLAEICVKRPVFATMLVASLVVVAPFHFFSLGVDLFPKIDFLTITVRSQTRSFAGGNGDRGNG